MSVRLTTVFVFCLIPAVCHSVLAEDAVIEPGARPRKIVDHGAGEGPVWHPRLGMLFSGDGHINQLTRQNEERVYRKDAGTNGLLFDAQGRLWACESTARRITRTEKDGSLTVVADSYQGKKFNTPNDLTVDSRGRLYFTDPRYGVRSGIEQRDAAGKEIEGVYRIDPDGTVARIITHEVDRPNGLVISADDRFLYVADNNNDNAGAARILWRFDLNQDGTIRPDSRKRIFDWENSRGPDGMEMDIKGRLYVAGGLNNPNPPFETTDRKGGVYVLSPEGKLLAFIPVPNDEVTNCAFGDDDLKTLYITGGGTLWSIRLTTAGQVPWSKLE